MSDIFQIFESVLLEGLEFNFVGCFLSGRSIVYALHATTLTLGHYIM